MPASKEKPVRSAQGRRRIRLGRDPRQRRLQDRPAGRSRHLGLQGARAFAQRAGGRHGHHQSAARRRGPGGRKDGAGDRARPGQEARRQVPAVAAGHGLRQGVQQPARDDGRRGQEARASIRCAARPRSFRSWPWPKGSIRPPTRATWSSSGQVKGKRFAAKFDVEQIRAGQGRGPRDRAGRRRSSPTLPPLKAVWQDMSEGIAGDGCIRAAAVTRLPD